MEDAENRADMKYCSIYGFLSLFILCLSFSMFQESRSVFQLQYMSWPDRGVPSNPDNVLAMVEKARHLQGSGPNPLCVHCRFNKWALWGSGEIEGMVVGEGGREE